MKRTKGKLIISLVVIMSIAVGLSYAGGHGGAEYRGISVFFVCGALAFLVNWLAFIPSAVGQTERYYDLAGSLTYVAIIVSALMLTTELSLRAYIAAAMVVVWACRLGGFLFLRIRADGNDHRFDAIKIAPLRFFMAWTMQGLWVLFTAACALAIITSQDTSPIGVLGFIGLVIWCIGFTLEVIADHQKRVFRRNSSNAGKFIKQGLWSWSQHPNYFGEIVLWCGMAVLALPILSGLQWFTLISPVFVTLLLTKVSGIPTLLKKSEARWGDQADYQTYKNNTSLLVPLPPKS